MIRNHSATHRPTLHPLAPIDAQAVTPGGRVLRAAIAALTTFALILPAFASDGGSIIKKRRDRDVTVIVIDNNDRHKKRIADETSRKPDRSGIIKRRDDGIRIILNDDRNKRRIIKDTGGRRDANAIYKRPDNEIQVRIPHANNGDSGHSGSGGPKIIVIDRNSDACKGSGVCVIRP